MRLAESAGLRCVLALSTVATAALIGRAWPRHHRADPRPPVTRTHTCHTARATPAPPPVQAEDPYVATLRSIRGELERCMANHADLQVRLSLDVLPSGRVDNVEVKAMAKEMSAIDLHLVKCVETAVAPLQFPPAADAKRISTFLNK